MGKAANFHRMLDEIWKRKERTAEKSIDINEKSIEAADQSLFRANEMSSNGDSFGVFQNIEGVGDVENDDDDDGFF
ncbi:Protein CBG18461 [Caenorhabditis briggsae]|uniref:Protein CBG18461 n=1 Tax=Caenorhabditis briggsae TaxID=6238 RepID=A8XTD3_CAEBR|nr:Protein CBG18461 [Caenorhabditis briggsae]CAP35910.1 Protein CBG18461 [Caenorhabditis briggsae]